MPHRRGQIVLAAFAALSAGWAAPDPPGDRAGFPTPPKQAEPWSPPATRLPKFLVSATRTLFDQGLPDPRGCEYRVIDVRAGDIWGVGGNIARTHGWVLPRATNRQEDFAVCWNGLIYPVVTLGDRADLDADLHALVDSVEPDGKEVRKNGRREAFGGFRSGGQAIPEGFTVTVEEPMPIKVCLLLRLGRADLAESLFAACTSWKPGGPRRDLTDYGISYLTLASDWAWSIFDRAIGAHMRGDDRIALADSRTLVEASKKIEARAAAMGFPRPQQMIGNGTLHPYLHFLGQLYALREDQERRAREPRRGEVPPRDADAAPRIAALIGNLDQLAVRQFSQPGWVDLTSAPAVQALIAEGDDAVEPLLQVLESDTRLTRSVAFGRSHDRYRMILGANEAAYKALTVILRTANFDEKPHPGFAYGDPEGRKEQARLIRAYWEKNKGVPPLERWYRTLRDDAATPAQWHEATSNLIQPANGPDPGPGRAIHFMDQPPRKPGEAIAMKGDPLRDGRDPSVSHLIARRALDLARPERDSQAGGNNPLDTACYLALGLHRWDSEAARPVLMTVMNRCQDELNGKATGRVPSSPQALLRYLPRLADARAASGDLAALDEVAGIVRQIRVQDITFAADSMLELMARYPERPAIASAADWFFNDPRSPWLSELYRTRFQLLGNPGHAIKPAWLGLAGFRKRLEILLEDDTVLGTVTVLEKKADRSIEIRWKGQDSRERAVAKLDPSAPKPVSESPFRTSDLVAWHLSLRRIDGLPEFRLEWPQPRRDEAIEACREALKRLDR